MPTQGKHPSHTRSAGQIKPPRLINSPKTNNSRTHQLTIWKTHKLINPNLKSLLFILQYHSNFRSVLAKIQATMQVNRPYFQPFTPYNLFDFKKTACILHHFAFLDWLSTHDFCSPKTHFQTSKPHFLTTILPFLAMYFMVLKGFVYTFAVDIYAFYLVFSTILHCILHHFTLRFAPKRTAFSTKTHCVQHQNALRLAAYCTIFCYKQPKSWCKWRLF